ncbi:hypothetical protein QBC37DRAFT_315886 [Rhypophila decipiens]|uniref:Uncharacterized protein n=1 Tax=Rhypophila decipiens TaxID=261697 RepID=A0AAN6Y756_9PEZI|nr:hypothetical protein QBC37DRAFT_315886 [Rhypophila decipiens]
MVLLRSLFLAGTAAAAVVILPGGDPKPYKGAAAATSADDFYRNSAYNEFYNNTAKLIMTSHSVVSRDNISALSLPDVHPSGDSFIRGAMQAWAEHLHLVIRPDEVWFTILVQMNFYMISHAEEIRSLFVDHQGQQEIRVEEFTWYRVLIKFKDEIQKRVKTPWLLDWIMPNFSTTTDNDIMTANILMMGLTKAYFKFVGKVVCGLPSVTLLGELSDWEKLLAKLDRLPAFGKEPEEYKARLRPILTRFVQSYKEPDSPATREFWNSIVVASKSGGICGEPPVYVSGWLTGFYYWSDSGSAFARVSSNAAGRNGKNLVLDGIAYPILDLTMIPIGYGTVPFTMLDYNNVPEFQAYLAAGLLGKQITQGPPAGYKEALQRVKGNVSLAEDKAQHGTLKPLSGWMLYGPVDHNKTRAATTGVNRPVWIEENEPYLVQYSISRSMQAGEVCGVAQAP